MDLIKTDIIETIKNSQQSSASNVLLYVYPKDNTPGCTQQSIDFSDNYDAFVKQGIEVIGISKDSLESHEKFIKKFDFHQALISDPDLTIIEYLGAYGEKNNYGKKTMGVIRSTFLIDVNEQKIISKWFNVRAKGHVEKMMRELKV